MTVANTVRSVRATGNGTSTSFSTTPFGFFEVNVYVDGELVDPSDYTITQATPGAVGTITFNTAPAADTEVLIVSDTELVQTVDYVDNDAFPAETHERQMDRLTMAIMDSLASVKQTIRAPAWSAEIEPLDFASNPETVVWSNASGVPSLIAVDAAGSPWVTAIAAAAAPAAIEAAATAIAAAGYAVALIDYIPEAQHAAILARTSTYDATSDVQECIDAAALISATVLWPAGRVRCTGDIEVPSGNSCIDIQGAGFGFNSELEFSGTGATNGLLVEGTNYARAGSIRGMSIVAHNGATRGVTFKDLTQPVLDRCMIYGFTGHGLYVEACIMPTIRSGLIYQNGTASLAQVRFYSRDASNTTTTVNVFGLYVGGGKSGCVAGVDLDGISGGFWCGGACESSGVNIRIDKTPYTNGYSTGLAFIGVDMEHATGHYVEIGYGTASLALGTRSISFVGCTGFTSLSTTVAHGVKMKNCYDVTFDTCTFALSSGAEVSMFEIEGTCQGISIGPTRSAYSSICPWVRVGGVKSPDATPLSRWFSDFATNPIRSLRSTVKNISGATPNGSWDSVQGGIPGLITITNGSATNMTKLLGCSAPWIEVTLNAQNGNTTIVHDAGVVTDAFRTLTGSNLTMVAYRDYRFRYIPGFNMWFQVA